MIGQIYPSNRDGDVEVIAMRNVKEVDVRWLATGNVSTVQKNAILNGWIRDASVIAAKKTAARVQRGLHATKLAASVVRRQQEHEAMLQRKAGVTARKEVARVRRDTYVLERSAAHMCKIDAAEQVCRTSEIDLDESKQRLGVLEFDFKDRSGKWVLRFSRNNDFVQTRLGKLHNNVTQRARKGGSVQTKYAPASYAGATLSPLFTNPQSFCDWVVVQQGWGLGYQLDKDLLGGGVRLYSEDTCVFLPRKLNIALSYRQRVFTAGVDGRFRVDAEASRRTAIIGTFDTQAEAQAAYKAFRESYVRKLAQDYKEAIAPSAFNTLMVWELT